MVGSPAVKRGFAAGEHPRLACPGVVQPLRWWLSGDTDAMWLDRCGEDADRPFFHGLAERLLTDRAAEGQP